MLAKPSNLLAACAAVLINLAAANASEVADLSAAQIQQQGVAAYQHADYASAIKFFEARARMAPEDASVYYYLGNCYMMTNQTEQAAHMYSSCIRLDPTSQAGKFSLTALEHLGSKTKVVAPVERAESPDPAQVEAARSALPSKKAVDQSYNDALRRIKADRPTMKAQVDRIWNHLHDELSDLSPRSRYYAIDLERIRREGELSLEELQLRELRHECRVLGPEKIDVRAVPEVPKDSADDSKNALGVLADYYKPDKPFDPFDMNVSPEITANFLTVRDVFGDLKTYDPRVLRVALQMFSQLKRTIEGKQDNFDRDLVRAKQTLLRDIVQAKMRDQETKGSNSSSPYRQQTVEYQMSNAKMPRADNDNNLSSMDREVSDLTERSKKRITELQTSYNRDVDMAISGAKEQLSAMVASGLGSQLKHVSGNIQLVPLGTDLRTRNYVNFADGNDAPRKLLIKAPAVQPLKAKALKMPAATDAGKGSSK